MHRGTVVYSEFAFCSLVAGGSPFLSPLESAQIFALAATIRLAGSLTIKELDTFMSCDVLADKVNGVIESSSTGPPQTYFVNVTLLAGAVHKFRSKLTDNLQWEFETNKSRYSTGFRSFTLRVKLPQSQPYAFDYKGGSKFDRAVRDLSQTLLQWKYPGKIMYNHARVLQECFDMGTAGALLAANEMSSGAEQSAPESAPPSEKENTSQSGAETRTGGTAVQGQAPPSKVAGTVGDLRRAAVGTAASAVLAEVGPSDPFTETLTKIGAGKRPYAVAFGRGAGESSTSARRDRPPMVPVDLTQLTSQPGPFTGSQPSSALTSQPELPKHSPPATEELLKQLRQPLLDESRAYCAELNNTGSSTSAYYAQNGFGTLRERRHRVKTFMPTLYSALMSAMTSTRHLTGVKAKTKPDGKSSGDYDKHSQEIRLWAFFLCELVAGASARRNVMTPARAMMGVLLKLGNVSQRVMRYLCGLQLCCSYRTAEEIVCRINQRKVEELKEKVQNCDATQEMGNFIVDNYAVNNYFKFVGVGRGLTTTTATIAVLHCAFKAEPAQLQQFREQRTPGHSAFQPIDFTAVREHLDGDGELIAQQHALAAIRDQERGYQGLRAFSVYPNIDGRSSKYSDTEHKVVRELLHDYAHVYRQETAVVSDTEYMLSFIRLGHCNPDLMKNVLLLQGPMHVRMHVLTNLMTDPVRMVLWWCPLYYAIGLQRDQARSDVKDILDKMKRFIASKAVASSMAAPATSSATTAKPQQRSAAASYVDLAKEQMNSDSQHEPGEEEEEEDTEARAEYGENDDLEADPLPPAATDRSTQLYKTDIELLDAILTCAKFIELGGPQAGELHKHKDKQSHVKSFSRMQYIAQGTAVAATQYVNTVLPLVLNNAAQRGTNRWCAQLIVDHLRDGLIRLGIEPLSSIVRQGNAVPLLNTMTDITKYLAYCRRDKVCKSLIGQHWVFIHALQHRPDLLYFYLRNCTKANDNHVENHNSQTQRCLPANTAQSPATVAQAALNSQTRRDTLMRLEDDMQTNPSSAQEEPPSAPFTRSRGEIYIEETRHESETGKRHSQHIFQFMREHLEALTRAGASVPSPNGIQAMTEQCEYGRQRLCGEDGGGGGGMLRQYEQYLNGQRAQHKTQANRAAQGLETKAVDFVKQFPIALLHGFLMATDFQFAPGTRRSELRKDDFVTFVAQNYTCRDLCKHITDNDIKNMADAEEYLTLQRRRASQGPASSRQRTLNPAAESPRVNTTDAESGKENA
jgi:hypothetical protein